MTPPALLARLKRARIVRVLVFYLGASWAVLQVVDVLEGALSLPEWVAPVSVILLLIGLVVIAATAMVQAPGGADRAEDSPGGAELSPEEMEARVDQVVPVPVPSWATVLFTWKGAVLGGVAAFVVLIAVATLVPGIPGPSFGPEEAAADAAGVGVAVLPFSVNGAEMEVWREGMVDVLAGNLDGAGGLRTIDPRTVMSRWRGTVGDGEDPELGVMLEVARSAGARYAVVGSAVRIGDEVRLNTQIYDVVGGGDIGSVSVAGPNAEVLSLVDRLSVQAAAEVVATGGGTVDRLRHTTSLTTSSPDALRAYLEGEALYRGTDFAGAADAFRRAVATDSTFALAALRLSRSLGWLRNIGDQEAREALALARRFEDRLPPRERDYVAVESLVESGDQGSVAAARAATQSYPDDPEFWELYGEALWHQGGERGHSMAETMVAFERALELDPGFGPLYIHPMELAVGLGDGARARELLAAWEPLADPVEYRIRRSFIHLQAGDSSERAAAREYLPEVPVRDLTTGYVYALTRRAESAEADRVMASEIRRRGNAATADLLLASAHLGTGALDEALALAYSPTALAEQIHPGILLPMSVVGLDVDHPGWARLPGPQESFPHHLWSMAVVATNQGDAALGREYLEAAFAALEEEAIRDTVPVWLDDERVWADIASAFVDWKSGALSDARALDGFRRVHGLQAPPNGWTIGRHNSVRWWMAELLLRQARFDEARRYFDSLWDAPWGAFYTLKDVGLGDAYRGLGDHAAARTAYERFLTNWAAAPAESPLVVRAREGLQALGG
jgi:tetratricopeptide (TPR) repeat protein